MSNSNSKVLRIEEGVDQLIEKIDALSALVKNQEERIEMLTNQVNEFTSENERLADLNTALELKMQQTVFTPQTDDSGIDKAAYNHKINELVKEINACISLLNK